MILIEEEIKAIINGLVGGAKYGFKIRLPHAFVMTLLFRNDLSTKDKLRTIFKLVYEHTKNLATFATLYKVILLTLKYLSRRIKKYNNDNQSNSSSLSPFIKTIGRMIISLIIDGPMYHQDRDGGRDGGGGSNNLRYAHPGHPERSYHALVAGAIGGYFVWGKYSSINYQIVLYLTSRVLIATMKRIFQQQEERRRQQQRQRQEGNIISPASSSATIANSEENNFINRYSYSIFAAMIWGLVMMLFEENPDVLHPSLKKSMDEIYRYGNNKTRS